MNRFKTGTIVELNKELLNSPFIFIEMRLLDKLLDAEIISLESISDLIIGLNVCCFSIVDLKRRVRRFILSSLVSVVILSTSLRVKRILIKENSISQNSEGKESINKKNDKDKDTRNHSVMSHRSNLSKHSKLSNDKSMNQSINKDIRGHSTDNIKDNKYKSADRRRLYDSKANKFHTKSTLTNTDSNKINKTDISVNQSNKLNTTNEAASMYSTKSKNTTKKKTIKKVPTIVHKVDYNKMKEYYQSHPNQK